MPTYHGYSVSVTTMGEVIDRNGFIPLGRITQMTDESWQCTVYLPYKGTHRWVHHSGKERAIAAIVQSYQRHLAYTDGKIATAKPQSLKKPDTVDGISIT